MHNNLRIRNNIVSYDTETTGVIPYGDFKRWGHEPARPFAFSFFDDDGNSAYFRLQVDPFTRRVIPEKQVSKEVGLIIGNKKIRKVGHNLGFDIRMSEFSGIAFDGGVEDTQIMAHIITGGDELSYGLKELGAKYLNFSKDDETDLANATKKLRLRGKKIGWRIADKEFFGDKAYKADYWMAPPELCERYALGDAERTMLFYLLWKEEIDKDPNLLRVYRREMRLFWLTKKMEERGARVFPEKLKSLRKFYTEYADKWLDVAKKSGGEELNFDSPKQLVQKFFMELGYEPQEFGDPVKKPFFPEKWSPSNPKCDGEFLKGVADKGDMLAKAILEYRSSMHMITGFLDPYDKFRVRDDEGNWILHPNYRQTGPVTGRYACGDPNLMQVAAEDGGRKKAELILRPREAFGPRPGFVWYMPDYSQIEVWLFAYCSGEKVMIEALHSGYDFHGSIAKQVWGDTKEYAKEPSHYRKRGKLLMFCKVYGGGAKAVADLLGVSVEEARGFINDYDNRLPGVRQFMKRMVTRVEREGKFYTPMGRLFYFKQDFAYKSVNYLIQGLAAEIMKEAMIAVDDLFTQRWKGCQLILTIHDELVLEIPKKFHSKKLMKEIVRAMQGNFNEYIGCPVPLPVSVKYATERWSESKKVQL